MDSRNTRKWLTAGGVLSGAALVAGGQLTALIDTNALWRMLDILDLWPL